MSNNTIQLFDGMINELATAVADRAMAQLNERFAGNPAFGVMFAMFIEHETFKASVMKMIEDWSDSDQFDQAVRSIAENVADSAAENAAAEAIREHERDVEHVSADDVLSSREFDSGIEDAISNSSFIDRMSDRIDNLEDEDNLLEMIQKLYRSDNSRFAMLMEIVGAVKNEKERLLGKPLTQINPEDTGKVVKVLTELFSDDLVDPVIVAEPEPAPVIIEEPAPNDNTEGHA